MIERGYKKGRNYIFFPQLLKSMQILPPIDLKFTKLKKRLTIFHLIITIKSKQGWFRYIIRQYLVRYLPIFLFDVLPVEAVGGGVLADLQLLAPPVQGLQIDR